MHRSVPDVTAPGDPAHGYLICQADDGGCPNGLLYGGTSASAPIWASFVAVLNSQMTANLGFLNPLIYPLAGTSAFHSAASMGSDFNHVGLGSPNLGELYRLLTGGTVGSVSAANSSLVAFPVTATADGSSQSGVAVVLLDGNYNVVSGQSVSLTADNGSHATITATSATSNQSNGAALFTVTDTVPETVTLTASEGSTALTQTATINFVSPPATLASITGPIPDTVTADGTSTGTITITLEDANHNPTPGKLVTLSQGASMSTIVAPTPPVTDGSGTIQFLVSNIHTQTVTYTATDVTDGNLPVPGSAAVDFVSGAGGCNSASYVQGTANPAPGYLVNTFASGFLVSGGNQGFSYNCFGAYGMAWDVAGNMYVTDWPTGKIYKFDSNGGTADSNHLFSTVKAPATGLAIDPAGNMFASEGSVSGANGDIVPVDLASGAVGAAIASGIPCLGSLALDPSIPALFAIDFCNVGQGGSDSIWEVTGIDGASPSTAVYAQVPSSNTENFDIAVAPDGTLYDAFGTSSAAPIARITPGSPPAVTTLTAADNSLISLSGGLGMTVGGMQSGGDAQFVIAPFNPQANSQSSTDEAVRTVDLTGSSPAPGVALTTNDFSGLSNFAIGPDGCLYVAGGPIVARITRSDGSCGFGPVTQPPSITLNPAIASPNPVQGTQQSFIATLHYAGDAGGLPVSLLISGANPQLLLANADSAGSATFTYTGVAPGLDNLVALGNFNNISVASTLSQATWDPGTEVTFLTLNQSPAAAVLGQTVPLSANLADVSTSPISALSGQTVQFSLGASACSAVTNPAGTASCTVTAQDPGTVTMAANFTGTSSYNPSSASKRFDVVQLPSPTATPTPVPGRLKIKPRHLNFGSVDVGSRDTRAVTIINHGKITKKKTAAPITIEMQSATPDNFQVTQDCDQSLNPKAKLVKPGSCQAMVTFLPSAAQSYTGTLTIYDNLEPNEMQTVKIKGKGKQPKK